MKRIVILKLVCVFLSLFLAITGVSFGQTDQAKSLKDAVDSAKGGATPTEFKKNDSVMVIKKESPKEASNAALTLPDDFYAEETCQDVFSKLSNEKVSFNFENAPIRLILKSLSEISKNNLIISPETVGDATLRVMDVPWDEAIKILLRSYGLGAQCFDNIIRVVSLKQMIREAEFSGARIFRDKRLKENSCDEILLGEKKEVSFDFENGNLRNVLKFISEIGNINMVLSPDVKGKVIMKLDGVPWNIALKALLTNYFLGQECVGNIIRIYSVDNFKFDNSLISFREAKISNSKLLAAKSKKSKEISKKFGAEELDTLQPIPLELYKEIKDENPSLFQDLEHYSYLFNEKTELEQMDMGAYISVVRFYKQLIDKALEYRDVAPKTPLQVGYEQIRFVGTIMIGENIAALVETADNKGHTIRLEELFGPNFGIVQEISPSKITVVERVRNFDGNIESTMRDVSYVDSLANNSEAAQNLGNR